MLYPPFLKRKKKAEENKRKFFIGGTLQTEKKKKKPMQTKLLFSFLSFLFLLRFSLFFFLPTKKEMTEVYQQTKKKLFEQNDHFQSMVYYTYLMILIQ